MAVTGTGVAATLILTRHLHDVRGFGAPQTALVLAAFGLSAPATARLAHRLAASTRTATLTLYGPAAQGLALAALALALQLPTVLPLVGAVIAFGCGHVLGNTAAAALAMRHGAPPGGAAAALATAQYLGGALGPVLLATAPAGRATAALALAAATALAAPCVALILVRSCAPERVRPARESRPGCPR
jgi:predicted MFS family arabinose efflux permease